MDFNLGLACTASSSNFLLVYTTQVNSAFCARWLASLEVVN